MNILYVGPSWAARSYDTHDASESDYTSLYKELSLQNLNIINMSQAGASNQFFLDFLNSPNQPHSYKVKYDAIIWVYCEPMTSIIDKKSFLQSEDFWALRAEANRQLLDKIANLGVPVAMIGGHSDIEDCNYSNLEIIHPSWQKFLAESVGVKLTNGWGCELPHKLLLIDYPKLKPSKNLVNRVSDTWRAWCEMDLNGVFCWCHPNKLGNELFAREIEQKIQTWIKNL